MQNTLYNGITDAVQFAKGEITYTAFTEGRGITKSNYKEVVKTLAPDLRTLAEKYERIQNELERIQNELEQEKTKAEQAVKLFKQVRTDRDILKTTHDQLTREIEQLRENENKAKKNMAELERLRTFHDAHTGKDPFISFMGSYKAENIILVLLALFGVVGTFNMLWDTNPLLAGGVSLPLGFVLIHFTAKGETPAKIFCMLFELAVLGLYFEVIPAYFSKYVFWITPVVVVGLIAFGKRLGQIR